MYWCSPFSSEHHDYKSYLFECHSPSRASQQGYITNQNGYTAKGVAQLQEKTALSTALAAELLSPSCTWGRVGRDTY
ncbi:hypothetical protein IWW34DRAFT_139757 [Fusarium oxysporum f. sp. albedinis]|nr:hypothetical protein IWW34DRAFT_139757 [Fusarium oxysporum f. sp. albedinis]